MPSGERRREPDHEALRLEFARLRAARRLTFDALAERSGVSRTSLINLEQGVTNGSLDTWFRVADALGVPLAELIARLDGQA